MSEACLEFCSSSSITEATLKHKNLADSIKQKELVFFRSSKITQNKQWIVLGTVVVETTVFLTSIVIDEVYWSYKQYFVYDKYVFRDPARVYRTNILEKCLHFK